MKRNGLKKTLAVGLCAAMAVTTVGCGGSSDNKDTTAANGEASSSSKYDKFLTIDVFDGQANFQGTQSGWFAKVVKDKFNMELNIIAPNVAGGGDTLYQTRSASGNLGDLIIVNADKNKLSDMVAADLVYDMTDLIKDEKNLQKYNDAIVACSKLANKDGVWAVPSAVSTNDPLQPSEVSDSTDAPSLRWDIYKAVGYPEMNTLEDLLDVMEKMQAEARKNDTDGNTSYAFSWFKDWDGDFMQNCGAWACLYGYDTMSGFALAKADCSDIQSVLDSDGQYVRGLKFMYEANKRGLVDPESTTQNFDTLSAKYQKGTVLYSLWPWMGAGYYNTAENMAAGKGFQTALIKDTKCLSFAASTNGVMSNSIMIGKNTEDPQRMADFIDWLYSPEGICMSSTQTGGKCGPEGLTWEMKDGKPVLTDFGVKAFVDIDDTLQVPAEWGTGTWKDGISALNYNAVGTTDSDPETGMNYNYQTWDDYKTRTATKLSEDWSAHFDGVKTGLELYEKTGNLCVEAGTNYAVPDYSTDINTIKEQCKQVILENSWQMAFASSDDEFNSLLKDMQDTCKGLGFDQVYEVDKKNCEDHFAAIKAVTK